MRALPPRWAALAVRAAGGQWAPPVPRRGRSGPGPPPPREWALSVSPRGRLRVRLPCQVSVRPLDPQRCPGADRVLVSVSGGSPGRERERDPVRVEHDEALGQVAIVADGVDSKTAVDVRTPVKFDLDIKTSGTGCVKIQKIECDNCKIETEKGTSVLQSIKSHKIDIRTNGGKVIGLGTLYGNTDICATEKGSVNIEKLQGTTINISTEDGLLKTKYLYAESASLSSESGDIMLGSVHGNTNLQTKRGSITVDSSDGSLKASTYHGTIDVYVSQLRKVDLKSQKGSITVKVPASLKAYLELSGRKVDVSSEIQLKETQSASKDDHVTLSGHMNQRDETDKWIKADTQNGKVCLKSQSWIQSVKLKSS
ncbi:protein FAM185A [Molothrus ater]|uniref:protein FAM185A n=1 Tax=Molothrus ater TaxID=84834 RepID=UPI00174A9246|nr:protein FAM185A [Molothrus ater]XP_054487372.1 protein FAM185A [Agelaius phoeniceus]